MIIRASAALLASRLRLPWLCACLSVLYPLVARADAAGTKPPCPVEIDDMIDKVRQVCGVHGQPERLARGEYNTEAGKRYAHESAYIYQFPERGMNVIFDEDLRVSGIRAYGPYQGAVEGLHLGDQAENASRRFGKPRRQWNTGFDSDEFPRRKAQKAKIIERLPDPAPKRMVRAAFEEIEAIDQKPLPRQLSRNYVVPKGRSLSISFGETSGTINNINLSRDSG